MDNPVSIIIPVYNRAAVVGRAIESVLSQTYTDFELIIVDDGSTDQLSDTLEMFKDTRIRFVHQPNRGVSSARNKGVEVARYDYIAFLDSDDEWMTDKLEKQIWFITNSSQYRICYTGEQWIRHGKPFAHKKASRKYTGYIFDQCLLDCFIGCSTVLMRKSLFYETGGFDTSLKVCEDYDLWLRISAKYPVLYIDEPLIRKYGGHSGQLSNKYWGNDRFRIYSLYMLLKRGKLSYNQIIKTSTVFKKKCVVVAGGCLKRGKYRDFSYYVSLLQLYNALEYK